MKQRLGQYRLIKYIICLLLSFHYSLYIQFNLTIKSLSLKISQLLIILTLLSWLRIDIISMRTFIVISFLILAINCSIRPQPVKIEQVINIYNKTWYSGYLDIPFENYTAHVHYFYFPSQSAQADTDPVLFWFNGGPGCSSLLGALYQHGPFIFNDAFGSLIENSEAWNKRAHSIYIQSPAQVGFSYMDTPKEQYPAWNDDRTANLNLGAVLQFFNVFTQLRNRPTYLSGQSYAGIYVPTLAYKIHKYNTQYQNTINLKGFAVGNGCTDLSECQFVNDYARYQYALFNDIGILPDSDYEEVERLCNTTELSQECTDKIDQIDEMMDGINIYDAYRPCWQNNKNYAMKFSQMVKKVHRVPQLSQNFKGWAPPCVDSEGIDKFLDDVTNRKAMGIPDNMPNYSMCNDDATFHYDRSTTGSYWVYKQLIPLNRYKIVKYSGDSDPAVPISGTFKWVNKIRKELGLSTNTYWRPWTTKTTNGVQNSGSIWQFSKHFTMFRFKGVGHMAPQWNNLGGTKLINYLLFDEQP